jgi:hypothetical protein
VRYQRDNQLRWWCKGKLVRLNEDIKGTISYVDVVTVSMLVSKKISKGQSTALVVYGKLARLDEDIKGTINYIGGVMVSLLVSMKI